MSLSQQGPPIDPDKRFNEMISTEDGQTWWWPRKLGPRPTGQTAARRIMEYHRHFHGETYEQVISFERMNIAAVWMLHEAAAPPGHMVECSQLEDGALPYWRIDMNQDTSPGTYR